METNKTSLKVVKGIILFVVSALLFAAWFWLFTK
jgi:hypothetical protein